jgi:hypothetical protein
LFFRPRARVKACAGNCWIIGFPSQRAIADDVRFGCDAPGAGIIRNSILAAVFATALMACSYGRAAAGTYSYATLYGGPSTNQFATDVLLHGHFRVAGAMAGLAIDRPLFYFGDNFALLGEAQATHYFFEHPTTTFSAGLGIRYATYVEYDIPASIAVYMGPSYALDPFAALVGTTLRRHKFLNYVSSEITLGIPHAPGWAFSFRTFHRSGMYGLYARDVDEGSMIGIGIRRSF